MARDHWADVERRRKERRRVARLIRAAEQAMSSGAVWSAPQRGLERRLWAKAQAAGL